MYFVKLYMLLIILNMEVLQYRITCHKFHINSNWPTMKAACQSLLAECYSCGLVELSVIHSDGPQLLGKLCFTKKKQNKTKQNKQKPPR